MQDIKDIPRIKILDVYYYHLTLDDGDEMYITDHGFRYWQNLLPENFWKDKDWFLKHSVRQQGSSNVYKISTKAIEEESIDIVMKWNRMGEDIPGATFEGDALTDARFLSPFEEFQILQELRKSVQYENYMVELQLPLAIYVPTGASDPVELGRRKYLMDFILRKKLISY